MDRIDIGIASYENPDRLDQTILRLRQNTKSEYRILVVDNNSPDPRVREVIERHAQEDPGVEPHFLDQNLGYAGAVNHFFELAETELIAYCDNDCEVLTEGWDLHMAHILTHYPDYAMCFGTGPGTNGAYPIPQGAFSEILWGVGCFWMLRNEARFLVGEPGPSGLFDTDLGHQEEVDFQQRLMRKGWRLAMDPKVKLHHHCSSTVSPEAQERINRGIINWVNKWVRFYCGDHMDYHSPNVLRFEDWPPTVLYLERFYQQFLPGLNDNPEQVVIEGREYDLNKVPRAAYGGGTLYRGRIV
jgi:GT2 family glycosyltransferase